MKTQVGSRVRQFFFSVFMGMLPDTQQKISGPGSLLKSIDLLVQKDVHTILLVTAPGMLKRGMLTELLDGLAAQNIAVHIFSDVPPDPTDESALLCAQQYVHHTCQALLAIGGGSVIDCAKIAGALVVNPGKSVADISGSMQVKKSLPYFIAVPTTAVTGSEVTAGAVITSTKTTADARAQTDSHVDAGTGTGSHFKHPVNDLHLVPDVALLDPQLTLSMPAKLTAYTGIDALSHAVEAYTNKFAQPKTKRAACRAVQAIFANLPQAYENGQDLHARTELLEASYDAGYAITHNYVGYVHAISHALGALYGLPHGYINAILMPQVLQKYGLAAYDSLAKLAQCAGVAQADASAKQNAEAFIKALEQLNKQLGIPRSLDQLAKKDFDLIATRALAEGNPTYPVPVMWNKQDIIEVLEAVARG